MESEGEWNKDEFIQGYIEGKQKVTQSRWQIKKNCKRLTKKIFLFDSNI